jgi:hypothetical protein
MAIGKKPQFKLRALGRKNEILCRIDMWGFVSVMLALLFLFIPTTTDTPVTLPVDQPAALPLYFNAWR